MPSDVHKLNIFVCAFVALSLLGVLAAPSPVEPSRLFLKGEQDDYISTEDIKSVPENVASDAFKQAGKLFGQNSILTDEFAAQLMGSYLECEGADIVIIFNPGGFGWDSVVNSPGWLSVMNGITETLADMDYNVLVFDYQRSPRGIEGRLSESAVFFGVHPFKSRELAVRVEFLTRHIPEARVLITGESNGSNIVEETIRRLQDNPRVYAIQTGPPVIQPTKDLERSLVLRHNGVIPDSFSQGDVYTIFRANLEALFGIYQEHPGDILLYIGAPGHHYSWEYQQLREVISGFLVKHFG